MLKKVDSFYHYGKRTNAWLKVKHLKYQQLRFNSYELNPAGLTLISGTHRVACNGRKHIPIKEAIDKNGFYDGKIAYMEKTYTGQYRQPILL
jgi:hypothetical protein